MPPAAVLLALFALLLLACDRGDGAPAAPATPEARTVACSDLATTWADGIAVERAEGGYDVSACRREPSGLAEMVKPAERDAEQHDCARCNDGTPFGFRVQLAPAPSNTWVVFLEGGGFCDDRAVRCAGRHPALTTTPAAADGARVEVPSQGLFARDPSLNPAFHGANFVFAHYCSSDAWTGATEERRPSTADPDGWHYSGSLNVRAMFALLIDRFGLDDGDPETRVLFAGSSAGGIGVEANADVVAALLPAVAEDGRLRLVNDGGVIVDFEDPDHRPGHADGPLADLLAAAYDRWGSRHLPACEAAERAAGRDAGRCFLSTVNYPYITTPTPDGLGLPMLIQYAALDSFALGLHRIDPDAPAHRAAVERWLRAVSATLEGARWLFSGAGRPYHMLLLSDAGWALGPEGARFGEVLTRFWESGLPERVEFDLSASPR